MWITNKKYILIALSAFLLFSTACKKEATDSKILEANDLYRKSCSLIKTYIDSLANANDSTTLYGINDRFNQALTKLNFDYPSDTDLSMSEGENDTLTNLTEKYVILRDSMLWRFANPVIVQDSIPTDSINGADSKVSP